MTKSTKDTMVELNKLSSFVEDTRSGKFTTDKPVELDVQYKRIQVQEQDEVVDDISDRDIYLFGIS